MSEADRQADLERVAEEERRVAQAKAAQDQRDAERRQAQGRIERLR